MSAVERWHLVNEEVELYAPDISRDTTPDEFLETSERQHIIMTFDKVLVGCKQFDNAEERNDWVKRHPMGKRIELINPETQVRKAGNIVEVKIGAPPDERYAAMVIYIERELPPEHVQDWVI